MQMYIRDPPEGLRSLILGKLQRHSEGQQRTWVSARPEYRAGSLQLERHLEPDWVEMDTVR
jgi:hypothetical protein